jgi:hypothetical protein
VQYIIWDRSDWNGSHSGDKMDDYGGPVPHIDHIHVELTTPVPRAPRHGSTTTARAPQIAFQANTGSLWTVGSAGNRDWNLGLRNGTSPSAN